MAVLEKKKKKLVGQKIFEIEQFRITINLDRTLEVVERNYGAKILVTSSTRGYMTVIAPLDQVASQTGPTTKKKMPDRLFVKPRPDKK